MEDLQPNLVLTHSKIIKPRRTSRPVISLNRRTGKMEQVGTEDEVNEFVETRWSYGGSGRQGRKKDNPLSRPIQMYRWYFRYLKLALELESLNFRFVERQKVKIGKEKGTTKYKYKKVYETVKVNRSKYQGWDLDEVLTSNFDDWWRSHIHLFVELPTHVTEITSPEEVVDDDHYRYFRVDTRMKVNDVIRSLRDQIGESKLRQRVTKRTSLVTITGQPTQESLFNSYNATVMWLQGMTNEEILKSGHFRKSRGRKVEWLEDTGRGDIRKKDDFTTRPSAQNLNRMRDLLNPGRRLVLTVADGYFAKHPRNKKYFGK